MYKLFGIINLFDLVPDYVFPIFERDGALYFENCSDEEHIDEFYEIRSKSVLSRIKPLDAISYDGDAKDEYEIGNTVIVGFQYEENKYFIGTEEELKNRFKNLEMMLKKMC